MYDISSVASQVKTCIATYDVFGPDFKPYRSRRSLDSSAHCARLVQRPGQAQTPPCMSLRVAECDLVGGRFGYQFNCHGQRDASRYPTAYPASHRTRLPYIAANRYHLHLSCSTDGCCPCPLIVGRVLQQVSRGEGRELTPSPNGSPSHAYTPDAFLSPSISMRDLCTSHEAIRTPIPQPRIESVTAGSLRSGTQHGHWCLYLLKTMQG